MRDRLRLCGLHARVGDIFSAFAALPFQVLANHGREWLRRRVEVERAEVDPDHMLGMAKAELDRHARSDVAAVGAEPPVAEPIPHESAPEVGDRPLEHGLAERVGEGVPGQGRDDHVERVLGSPAVGGRVRQQR